MKYSILVAGLSAMLTSQVSFADLRVFACEPEWASLANEIGGEKVRVDTATTGLQDPHHIQARPSLIAKVRRADLVVCTGASLEAGWLPVLLKKSGNRKIQQGKPGYFMAAEKVELLGKVENVTQAMGDVHAEGNPHIQLDPKRVAKVADELVKTMMTLDQTNAAAYQQGYDAFQSKWQAAITSWEMKAASLRGIPIIVHHDSWLYLEEWLGLKKVATLEPKPGTPPSTQHLSKLVKAVEKTSPKVTIYSSYQNPKAAKWFETKTGIPSLKLPGTVGGSQEASDLYALFDQIIEGLLSQLK